MLAERLDFTKRLAHLLHLSSRERAKTMSRADPAVELEELDAGLYGKA